MELLVVISIIGILASMVLVPLSSARMKGQDVRIVSDTNQLRLQIESDAWGSDYRNVFVPNGSNYTLGSQVSTSTYTTLAVDALNNSTNGANICLATLTGVGGTLDPRSEITVVNNGLSQNSQWLKPPDSYSIWAKLNSGGYYCVDSSGNVLNNSQNPGTLMCEGQ